MFALIKDTITTQLNRRTSYNRLSEYSSLSNRRENHKQRARERASTLDLSLSHDTQLISHIPPPPYSANSTPRSAADGLFGEEVSKARLPKKVFPQPSNALAKRELDDDTITVLSRDNLRIPDENDKRSVHRSPRRPLPIPVSTSQPSEIGNGAAMLKENINRLEKLARMDDNSSPGQLFSFTSDIPRKRNTQIGPAFCRQSLQRLDESPSQNPISGLKVEAGPSHGHQTGGRHFHNFSSRIIERDNESERAELQCPMSRKGNGSYMKSNWNNIELYKMEVGKKQETKKPYGTIDPSVRRNIHETPQHDAGSSIDFEKHSHGVWLPATALTQEQSHHRHRRCMCQYCKELERYNGPDVNKLDEDMRLALTLQKRWDEEDILLRKQRAFALALQDGNQSNAAIIQRSMVNTIEASRSLGKKHPHVQDARVTAPNPADESATSMESLSNAQVPVLETRLAKAHALLAEASAMLDRCRKEEDAIKRGRETVRGMPREFEAGAISKGRPVAEVKNILEIVEKSIEFGKARVESLESELSSERGTKCVSCMEVKERSLVAVLGCKHEYCGDCIAGAFKAAKASREEFKCCGIVVPISHGLPFLPKTIIKAYQSMLLERSTPNPKYCSKVTCNAFIPPKNTRGPVCLCTICKTRTCKDCGKKEHSGVCSQDHEGKKVQLLAAKKGWKTCLNCGWILERNHGCLHMTCRCGAQWCYNCLKDWESCKSTCQRR